MKQTLTGGDERVDAGSRYPHPELIGLWNPASFA